MLNIFAILFTWGFVANAGSVLYRAGFRKAEQESGGRVLQSSLRSWACSEQERTFSQRVTPEAVCFAVSTTNHQECAVRVLANLGPDLLAEARCESAR